jgi:hypothetical protein
MKKLIFIFSVVSILAILSSCSMYKEPCEGVGSIEIKTDLKA